MRSLCFVRPSISGNHWEPALRSAENMQQGAACTKGALVAEAISVSGPVSGTEKTLTFETGKFAPQSMGAVVAY